MTHLADFAAIPQTEEQLRALKSAIAYDDNIELRMIGGRPVIYERKGDALAFVTASDPARAKAWIDEWSAEVARQRVKAGER